MMGVGVLRFLGDGFCCFCSDFFLLALDMRRSKAEGREAIAASDPGLTNGIERKRDL